MMKSLFNIVVSFLVISLMSCEQEKIIDLEFPFEGQKMVAYCMLSREDSTQLDLHLTHSLSGVKDTIEGDVVATLTDNDGNVYPFNFQRNIGKTKIYNTAGRSYYLSVNYQNTSVRSDEVSFPKGVDIVGSSFAFNEDSSKVSVRVSFQDDALANNYYTYTVTTFREGNVVEGGLGSSQSEVNYRVLFTDTDFNGGIHELVFEEKSSTPVFGDNYEFLGIEKIDEIIVKIYSVSEEIYLFNESIKNNNSELGNEFSDQTPIVSNINNGYGFVSAEIVDSVNIELR